MFLAAIAAASLSGSAFLHCQQAAAGKVPDRSGAEAVFAPFPSHLIAEATAGGIDVSWKDSPDTAGAYAVYRSKAAPSAADLDSALRLATVPRGVQQYLDKPGDSGRYFYLVLALAPDGTPYKVVIPARNATLAPVAALPPAAQATAPAAPAVQPAAAPKPAAVDALTAAVKGDAVILTYTPASPGMSLVAYRGTAPMMESTDLLDATLIATFTDKGGIFTDYPVPGIEYWYAILGETDLKSGRIVLRSGHNVTAQSISIAGSATETGFVAGSPKPRMTPLPALVLTRAPEEGAAALPPQLSPPPQALLDPETEKAIAFLLADQPRSEPKIPSLDILPEERMSPSGGEEYTLSQIVSGKFTAGDWKASVDELRSYLSLNRGPDVTARAHFYLGEALTHAGAYRDAFFELLTARQDYMVETKPWIDFVLYRLRKG